MLPVGEYEYSSALRAVRGAANITDATTVFEKKYEAAGQPDMSKRITYAKQVLAQYG
jgi:hypothetical protein